MSAPDDATLRALAALRWVAEKSGPIIELHDDRGELVAQCLQGETTAYHMTLVPDLAAEVLAQREKADTAHMGFVRIIQATDLYEVADPEALDATPERALAAVSALRERRDAYQLQASQIPGLSCALDESRWERDALRARAERAEAELAALKTAVQALLAAHDRAHDVCSDDTRPDGAAIDAIADADEARERLRPLVGEV